MWFVLQQTAFCAGSSQQKITIAGISRPFFSPALKQIVQLSLHIHVKGIITVQVVDPDGYLVREIVSRMPVNAGVFSCEWDGKAAADGLPMPDEAYGLRIELASGGKKEVYFPSDAEDEPVTTETARYDREAGTISYQVARSSRVRITALLKETGTSKEQVFIRLLDWAPRVSGPIVEHWQGYDQERKTYVPDVPGSELRVELKPLPEGAVIVAGGHTRSFEEWKAVRQGQSLFVHRTTHTDGKGNQNAKK